MYRLALPFTDVVLRNYDVYRISVKISVSGTLVLVRRSIQANGGFPGRFRVGIPSVATETVLPGGVGSGILWSRTNRRAVGREDSRRVL